VQGVTQASEIINVSQDGGAFLEVLASKGIVALPPFERAQSQQPFATWLRWHAWGKVECASQP